jgi:hypothetical protein
VRGDERLRSCRNCGRETREGRLDAQRWCNRCRDIVKRRASRWARVVAVLTTVLVGMAIASAVGPVPRLLVLWALLLVAVYAFVFVLGRRVAFEIIRARGVEPEE